MGKTICILVVLLVLCGYIFHKMQSQKAIMVPNGYDPSLCSQTFKFIDRVNIFEEIEIDGVPAINAGTYTVVLMDDAPYRKESTEPRADRFAY